MKTLWRVIFRERFLKNYHSSLILKRETGTLVYVKQFKKFIINASKPLFWAFRFLILILVVYFFIILKTENLLRIKPFLNTEHNRDHLGLNVRIEHLKCFFRTAFQFNDFNFLLTRGCNICAANNFTTLFLTWNWFFINALKQRWVQRVKSYLTKNIPCPRILGAPNVRVF